MWKQQIKRKGRCESYATDFVGLSADRESYYKGLARLRGIYSLPDGARLQPRLRVSSAETAPARVDIRHKAIEEKIGVELVRTSVSVLSESGPFADERLPDTADDPQIMTQ